MQLFIITFFIFLIIELIIQILVRFVKKDFQWLITEQDDYPKFEKDVVKKIYEEIKDV